MKPETEKELVASLKAIRAACDTWNVMMHTLTAILIPLFLETISKMPAKRADKPK